MTLTASDLTHSRFTKQTQRVARSDGWAATTGGQAIVTRHLDAMAETISLKLATTKASKGSARFLGVLKDLYDVDPVQLSLVGLQCGVSSVASCLSLTKTILTLGRGMAAECFGMRLREWDAKKALQMADDARKAGVKTDRRLKSVRQAAKTQGFRFEDWADDDHTKAGKWLLEVLTDSPVFVLAEGGEEDEGALTLTEEAMGYAMDIIDRVIASSPILLPSPEPIPAWTRKNTDIQGFRLPLVRRRDKAIQAAINAAIRSGAMQPVLDAVNAAQDVPWRINGPILDLVEHCRAEGIPVDGLPGRDLPIPPKVEHEDPKAARKAKMEYYRVKEFNRALIGQRMTFDLDCQTARQMGDQPFYTPMNLDYRGRMYGMSSFNYQRQDYVRSLFLFAEGKPITDDGIRWLKVHVANTGDFGKVSKKAFSDRVAWCDGNIDRIRSVAQAPLEDLWWTEADAPFQFLAACMELSKAWDNPEYVCHLPIGFDGSCSGIQHLCAMTRADEGYLVNLTAQEKPNDVYQVVADLAKAAIEADQENPELEAMAKLCLGNGINRSLVKRNVMTYSYSSTRFGMKQQFLEDTMRPLQMKVLTGELEEHPWSVLNDEGKEDNGFRAATYLASHVYRGIEAVIQRPADAMHFLQDVAKAYAGENKPVVWTTPNGMPVVLRCPKVKVERVNLFLNDRGVRRRFQPRIAEETKGIDAKKAASAIAPSFVHSLDACHLQTVVNEAHKVGITNVALVHDSFGCLPADATEYRGVIKRTFRDMYVTNDVLQIVRDEAVEALGAVELPAVPEYGTLDLNGIMESEYAFA